MGAQVAADGSAWVQAHLSRFEVDVWVEDSCDEASLGRLQWVRLVDIELNLRKTSPHHHPRGSHEHPERTKHGVPTRMLDAKEILGAGAESADRPTSKHPPSNGVPSGPCR